MEIRKATLTASLTLDDGTQVPVAEVTGDPASGGRVMVRFGLPSVPPGRRIKAAAVRNEDTGTEFGQWFSPYLPVPRAGRGDMLTMIFGPLPAKTPGRLP